MTDSEIVKALECCSKFVINPMCSDCPFNGQECIEGLPRNALSLITRQQTEIERLHCEVKEKTDWISLLKKQVVDWKDDYCKLKETLNSVKSEARREFANRLQLIGMEDGAYVLLKLEQIQKLLKEMEGEQ